MFRVVAGLALVAAWTLSCSVAPPCSVKEGPIEMRWRNKQGGLRWLVLLGLSFVLSSVLVAILYGLTRTQGPVQVALGVVMTLIIPVVGLVAIVRRLF